MRSLRPLTRLRFTITLPTTTAPFIQSRISRLTLPFSYRTMASSTTTNTPLPEWLVIVPDFPDVLEKRLAIRPQHLQALGKDRVDMILWGGKFDCISLLHFLSSIALIRVLCFFP